ASGRVGRWSGTPPHDLLAAWHDFVAVPGTIFHPAGTTFTLSRSAPSSAPRYRTRAAHTAESITSTSSPSRVVALTRCSASSGGSRARIRSVVVRRCSASRPSAASRPVASTSASFRGDLSVIILPPLPNASRNGRFSPTSLSGNPFLGILLEHISRQTVRKGGDAKPPDQRSFPRIAGLPNVPE